ncbi:hypothetical protein A5647_21555 [Mycobacterium sp. 1100029.7]|nr:hypothetical protein A5647_21555 [Mycobacterium sp. 1100029.7]
MTVQAAPSVPAPIGPTALPLILPPTIEVVPAQDDFVADQRMLDSIRASGYTVYDAQSVLRNAHEVCRLFRQGKSVDEVNQQMAAETGASMADVLQLSSSAMLSYPNCS